MSSRHSTLKSFSYAFSGIKTAFVREPHFKIHFILAVIAISLAFFFGFSPLEWAVLLTVIFLVLILEAVNTSLEAIVNLVSPEIKEEAKVAKDVSAASVLLSAIFAVLIGLLLFLPRIFK